MLQFITRSLAAARLPPERRVMEELDLKEIAGGALLEKMAPAMPVGCGRDAGPEAVLWSIY